MFLNGNVITRHQLSNVVTPTLPSGDFIHVAMESVAEKRWYVKKYRRVLTNIPDKYPIT